MEFLLIVIGAQVHTASRRKQLDFKNTFTLFFKFENNSSIIFTTL